MATLRGIDIFKKATLVEKNHLKGINSRQDSESKTVVTKQDHLKNVMKYPQIYGHHEMLPVRP